MTDHIIEGLRAARLPLLSELAGLLNGGSSRAEIQRGVRAFAAQAANEGDQRLQYAVAIESLTPAFTLTAGANIAPLFASLLGPEAFAAALCKHLDQVPKGTDAAERAARVAAIRAELDRIERLEELAIVASENAGAPVPRRGDARPEIVFALIDPDTEIDAFYESPTTGARLVPAAQMEPEPRQPRAARSEYMSRKRE